MNNFRGLTLYLQDGKCSLPNFLHGYLKYNEYWATLTWASLIHICQLFHWHMYMYVFMNMYMFLILFLSSLPPFQIQVSPTCQSGRIMGCRRHSARRRPIPGGNKRREIIEDTVNFNTLLHLKKRYLPHLKRINSWVILTLPERVEEFSILMVQS